MQKNLYDLIIIGAGPAGLSAAIYAGRAKLKTLVLERSEIGGQIKITSEVVNYPGLAVTDGKELTAVMKKQAVSFGAEFVTDDVTEVNFSGDIKTVKTKVNEEYRAIGVIIATGARPRKLGFEGEAEFAGRGIAYCATCDGEFFTGKDVFVIGAGFAAAEEAIFLTRFARKVTVIAREPEFTCSKTIADKALAHPQIEVKFNSEIVYARGDKVLKEAKFKNNVTGETWVYSLQGGDTTFGVFIFVGYEPLSDTFKGKADMDKYGYIVTNDDMATNTAGVYAAGDIRPKRLRQLVTAVSDGAIASTAAEKYIDDIKHKLGLEIAKEEKTESDEPLISEEVAAQIEYVMSRCESKVTLAAVLLPDNKLSAGIKGFLSEFGAVTDKAGISIYNKGENKTLEKQLAGLPLPALALMDKDGKYTGVSFGGIPGGHELESFVLAIYNAAGPGQAIDGTLLKRIKSLKKPINIKVGVSLSCTMCPEVVQAAQRVALLNNGITAAMLDLAHFPEIRDQHNIMSVPAMIIGDSEVVFGRKNLEEVVELLENL